MRYKMITYFQLEELILHHWNKALVINYKIGEGGGGGGGGGGADGLCKDDSDYDEGRYSECWKRVVKEELRVDWTPLMPLSVAQSSENQ